MWLVGRCLNGIYWIVCGIFEQRTIWKTKIKWITIWSCTVQYELFQTPQSIRGGRENLCKQIYKYFTPQSSSSKSFVLFFCYREFGSFIKQIENTEKWVSKNVHIACSVQVLLCRLFPDDLKLWNGLVLRNRIIHIYFYFYLATLHSLIYTMHLSQSIKLFFNWTTTA